MTSPAGSWPPPLVLPLWFGLWLGLWLGLCRWLPALRADDDLVAGLVAVDLPHDTNAITSLTPKQAERMLAAFRGAEVRFTMRDRGVVTIPHGLPLDALRTLSADTAKVLAGFRGSVVSLNGLTRLEADAAKALATCKADMLLLNGLATLSPEAALVLVQTTAWDGSPPGVVAFDTPDSIAVAAALATRTGPLRLPNLKRISPKTLSALIAKEDVEIPLIETLELIREPDGSETDDFVVPPAFDERQERQRQQVEK